MQFEDQMKQKKTSSDIKLKDLLEALVKSGLTFDDPDVLDTDLVIAGLASLEQASASHLSFLANPKYVKQLDVTKAGAVFLAPGLESHYQGLVLRTSNPYLAYAKASQYIQSRLGDVLGVDVGLHPSAVVHDSVVLGQGVAIGPGVIIGAGSSIGDNVHIGAHVVIGRDTHIGSGSRLAPHVVLYDQVTMGPGCRVQSHATLGSDGFGFAPTAVAWEPIAQLGGVTIGEGVHIGANTSIDRGALQNTIIGDHVIIDNQVQIAHNVVIGAQTAIAGCVGIAGSTRIGSKCTLAGAAGVAGHLIIADGVHIGMQAQVTKSIPDAGHYASGTGLYPLAKWRRVVGKLRQLIR